ncbi:MAG: alcohol dehydrogenase catalytic domain-containing protein [Armatimonadota bacterium]|nr:alcohol dehydrogenase catalytic domain-containing protein [Armatimonadota bacterium]MDW8142347.1 alcohol dehydrogenase catalytic domain-containing protein [Armatimonadota bacterium]
MKAILYSDWEKLELVDLPEPKPSAGEVLIKVGHVGICGSEIECVVQRHPRRQPPLIMGHEFAGTVVELGEGVTNLKVGQRVAVNPIIGCWKCRWCQQGRPNLCERRKLLSMQLPGAFAEFVVAPAENCHPLPEGMSTREGAITEPVANAVHALRLAQTVLPERVIVFGAGPIGLVCAQVARAFGATFVAIVEVAPQRIELAKQFADVVINPQAEEVLSKAKEATDGLGFDLALDAVGRSITRRLAVESVHPTGVVIWVGLHEDETTVPGMQIIYGEKVIKGSSAYTDADFATALKLIATGKVEVDNMVREFPLEQGVEVFWKLARGEAPEIVKALLRP